MIQDAQNNVSELDQLFEVFIAQAKNLEGKSEATIKNYRDNFGLLKKFKPDVKLEDSTSGFMVAFFTFLNTRERLVGNKMIVRPLKNSTIGTIRDKLDVFFKWLVENKYLEKSPFKDIKHPDISYTDKRALKDGEFSKLYYAISAGIEWDSVLLKKRNLAFFMLMVATGIRIGECVGLNKADLDMGKRLLTVRAEVSKSKRTKILPLTVEVIPLLEEYLFCRAGYKTEELWVSSTADECFTKHGAKHLLERLKKATGIYFHWHCLRHTFATNFYMQTHALVNLQTLMGHRQMKTTQSYLRSLPDEDNVRQMNAFSLAKIR